MGKILFLTGAIVCPLDLIYLFVIGAWYDPIPIIEITEVTILVVLVGLGIYKAIRFVADEAKK